MRTYDKQFKEQALKLSDEIGVGKAAEQLGIPYYTLANWRSARKHHGEQAFVGSGHQRVAPDPRSQREIELECENVELKRANQILKEALGFFVSDQKK